MKIKLECKVLERLCELVVAFNNRYCKHGRYIIEDSPSWRRIGTRNEWMTVNWKLTEDVMGNVLYNNPDLIEELWCDEKEYEFLVKLKEKLERINKEKNFLQNQQ